MDKHGFGAVLQSSQSGTDGISTGGPAVDDCHFRAAVHQFNREFSNQLAEFRIPLGHGDADLASDIGSDNAPKGVHQDGFATQRNFGFGHAVAEALARAG